MCVPLLTRALCFLFCTRPLIALSVVIFVDDDGVRCSDLQADAGITRGARAQLGHPKRVRDGDQAALAREALVSPWRTWERHQQGAHAFPLSGFISRYRL